MLDVPFPPASIALRSHPPQVPRGVGSQLVEPQGLDEAFGDAEVVGGGEVPGDDWGGFLFFFRVLSGVFFGFWVFKWFFRVLRG